MNERIPPRVSMIVVNFRGGRLVELLLRSLERTITEDIPYEVVVVNNRRSGYTLKSRWQFLVPLVKHYAKAVIRGTDMTEYVFERPTGMCIVEIDTGIRPVFWHMEMGVRGKSVSQSHAVGLLAGYRRVSPLSGLVLLLDQDVVFLKKGWLGKFVELFATDQDVVLVGAFADERTYERPFLRPFCLMFRRHFYEAFGDVFAPAPQGDTCSRLTYLCEDNSKKYCLFRNSPNDPTVRASYSLGDVAVDEEDDVFLVHKSNKSGIDNNTWISEVEKRLSDL